MSNGSLKPEVEERMRLSEDKVRRIAERVVDELAQQGLVRYTDPSRDARAVRVKAVYDAIMENLQTEAEIDAEVERILATYSRTLKPIEQDVLRRKHKEEVARKRGFVL
ncbi:DUF507 family protein [Kallotenue papyrolyticum]|uniref:DUF507 family protein n=1 Tax=Kallotenue papyrolyticum TaxID=1325125 RepID=UPI0023ECA0B2|nr:DUF507 family protein [Kallotenue papyrolyticum]